MAGEAVAAARWICCCWPCSDCCGATLNFGAAQLGSGRASERLRARQPGLNRLPKLDGLTYLQKQGPTAIDIFVDDVDWHRVSERRVIGTQGCRETGWNRGAGVHVWRRMVPLYVIASQGAGNV